MLKQAATSLETETACQRFDVCLDPDDRCRVFLYEIYDDRQAFDLHLKTPHFLSFNSAVSPWVADKRVRLLDVAPLQLA
ncbi:MAG: antibiotic biosynthesis monooxygenase [Planctomycetota bacterium]|nr:antibiotic biosynthesis monooxygenase [Planctomycetota bacterium]